MLRKTEMTYSKSQVITEKVRNVSIQIYNVDLLNVNQGGKKSEKMK
jgi:hypothetical protein